MTNESHDQDREQGEAPAAEDPQEPSTESNPDAEPRARAPEDPEPDHEAVGIGVIGAPADRSRAESARATIHRPRTPRAPRSPEGSDRTVRSPTLRKASPRATRANRRHSSRKRTRKPASRPAPWRLRAIAVPALGDDRTSLRVYGVTMTAQLARKGRVRASIAAAFIALVVALVGISGPVAAVPGASPVSKYVALGDSVAAGQGGGDYVDACLRSPAGYPELLNAEPNVAAAQCGMHGRDHHRCRDDPARADQPRHDPRHGHGRRERREPAGDLRSMRDRTGARRVARRIGRRRDVPHVRTDPWAARRPHHHHRRRSPTPRSSSPATPSHSCRGTRRSLTT